jgi:hypothetical protein
MAKAFAWCYLQAEFERKPAEMPAARLMQLRLIGSELGRDVTARARLGVDQRCPKPDPADTYFD